MKDRRIVSILLTLVISLFLVQSAPACITSAITAGGGDFTSAESNHDFIAGGHFQGWFIGPQIVNADPSAGSWLKHLENPFEGPDYSSSRPYTLIEVFKVGEGPAWTDWHEEILSPGWGWTAGRLYAMDSDDGAVRLSADAAFRAGYSLFSDARSCLPIKPLTGGEISDGNIDFYFEPLEAGSWVFILKQLAWIGGDKLDMSSPIRIAEYPSTAAVPLPAAAWLLGSGLVGLVAIRRRRAK